MSDHGPPPPGRADRHGDDPVRSREIAITGVGVRLPAGVDDLPSLWSALVSGRRLTACTRVEMDGRRSPVAPGTGAPGGLLSSVDSFDPSPFGITRQEATHLDPQQRLILETTWDALADAEIGWYGLRGQDVGVFVGAYAQDWLQVEAAVGEPYNGYVGTGTSHAMLANRLSYLLDLHGPSLTLDTACSSSLTALHLAVQSLRRGECERALVSTAALGFDPTYRAMTQASLPFSPSGDCRPFDAAADGIARGEGAITLLLESGSSGHGRRARAVVLGSAVNHDGRTNGLTAPNAAAQTRLLRSALADAQIDPSRVGYLEAHGTGTILGDPIEANGIAGAYGRHALAVDDSDAEDFVAGDSRVGERPPRSPIQVRSVKGTLGHLEAAAGLAGLVTAMLVLEHRVVPGQASFTRLNASVGFDATELTVSADETTIGPEACAGVSSFGFGGSNAHVILASPPGVVEDVVDPARVHLLTLDAAGPSALSARRDLARRLVSSTAEADRAGVMARTTRGTTPGRWRRAWSADDAVALARALEVQPGGSGDGRVSHHARRGTVWVFNGQGSAWAGMADELLEVPQLGPSWKRWDEEVEAVTGWSLSEHLRAPATSSTEHDQIAIAVVQLALAEVLLSWGHHPTAVVGHSMGEVTAAVLSGALTSAEGFRILSTRARWIERGAAGGRMVAVRGRDQDVDSWLTAHPGVGLAAVNGRGSFVLSGHRPAIEELLTTWRATGVRHRMLPVSYAFHSPMLDQLVTLHQDLHRTARELDRLARPAHTPQYSTVTGRRLDLPNVEGYWWENVRSTVRFADALDQALADSGSRCLVEIGPHAVLQHDLESLIPSALTEPSRVLATRDRSVSLASSLGRLAVGLHTFGVNLDLSSVVAPLSTTAAPLPYAWQRERFWPAAASGTARVNGTERSRTPDQPLSTTGPVVTPAEVPPRGAIHADASSTQDIVDFVCRAVAGALDWYDLPAVPPEVPLRDWELESLAVVTLRNAVEQQFGVEVPLALLLPGPSPVALVHALAPRGAHTLATAADPTLRSVDVPGARSRQAVSDDDDLDQLSDAQLTELLAALEDTAAPSIATEGSEPR